jgi:hypothetical protein
LGKREIKGINPPWSPFRKGGKIVEETFVNPPWSPFEKGGGLRWKSPSVPLLKKGEVTPPFGKGRLGGI